MSNIVKVVLLSAMILVSYQVSAASTNPGQEICAQITHTSDWDYYCSSKEVESFVIAPNKLDNNVTAMYQYTGSSNVNSVSKAFRKLIALQSSVRGYDAVWSNAYQADIDYLKSYVSTEFAVSNAFTPVQQNGILNHYKQSAHDSIIIFFDFKYYVGSTIQFSRYALVYNYVTKKGLFLGRKLYISN